ncbi:MAG TPA: SMC-Scp complex subunit ScpB, partial [Cellvibrionaceae bacterium]|nr:SMC-Scp complex subunit ScpB [Cellvibrionaceae bacterium]
MSPTSSELTSQSSTAADGKSSAASAGPKSLVEAAIFAAVEPIPTRQLLKLWGEAEDESHRQQLQEILSALQADYQGRGVELVQVASGWRFQVPKPVAQLLEPLYQEKPKRLSRVILETLAIIAHRQPITRAEIEALRGVAVSAEVLKNLIERQWICSLGPKEIPGRPMQYGTTDEFLDYFNLQSLAQLPSLLPPAPAEPNALSDISAGDTAQLINDPRPDEN